MNTPIKRLFICATSVMALASCGGGNDVASGGAGTGVTSASAVTAGAPSGAAANSATSTSATSTKAAMDRVGFPNKLSSVYFDMTAPGDMSSLPAAIGSNGMKNYNMVNFGAFFATDVNSSGSISQTYLGYMKAIMALESPGTLNFYSVGGGTSCSNGDPRPSCNGKTFFTADGNTFAAAAIQQVKAYNASLSGVGKIDGIDLELENGHCSSFILDAAKAIKAAGLLVSIAPQVVGGNLSWGTGPNGAPGVVSNNTVFPPAVGPQGQVWYSSGGGTATSSSGTWPPTYQGGCRTYTYASGGAPGAPTNNEYSPAISAGAVDIIQAQLYNQYGYLLDNANPANLGALGTWAGIFSTLKNASCVNAPFPNSSCIPVTSSSGQSVKVLLGQPVNFYAGSGAEMNCAACSPAITSPSQYSQVLQSLTNDIGNYLSNIDGMMMWQASSDWLSWAQGGESSPGQTAKAFAKYLGIAN